MRELPVDFRIARFPNWRSDYENILRMQAMLALAPGAAPAHGPWRLPPAAVFRCGCTERIG
jgi:hypothetical protein